MAENLKRRMKFSDFYMAWKYLSTTEVFWHDTLNGFPGINFFTQLLEINVVKVNPENNMIDDNDDKNTKIQVWLEVGEPYIKNEELMFNSHNINYDCGGDTFEEAIIEMANLVYDYNN